MEFYFCRDREVWNGEYGVPLSMASLVIVEMDANAEAYGDEAVVGGHCEGLRVDLFVDEMPCGFFKEAAGMED